MTETEGGSLTCHFKVHLDPPLNDGWVSGEHGEAVGLGGGWPRTGSPGSQNGGSCLAKSLSEAAVH